MRQSCPKSCPSAKDPFSGFYQRNLNAGESFIIEPDDVNHLVFVISGELAVSSEERRDYRVAEGSFFFCYNCGHYTIEAKSDIEIIVAFFARPGAACDINTFNVVFRRHYPGYTPGVWMQIQRKDEILADLVETDAPIYHISKKYGFSSSSHLGEYCKKYLGDTPTRVRSKFRKKKR